MAFFKPFLLYLALSSLLIASGSAAAVSGTIERIPKQHILATVPPGAPANTPQPFLTSPSGRYAASFVRSKTAPGAGRFGNGFCYIIVDDTSTGRSEWESECAPVTDTNTCTLVFTDAGLEVFDGSQSVWSTEADGDHVEELTLVDQGDMRIIDKDGELAWKASDDARANQGCGLAPESPPFAGLIGGGNGPFGQPAVVPPLTGQMQQQQIAADLTQSAAAPLVNGQQQTAGDSLQSVTVAPPADEQQTTENCPLSAVVAPETDGQPQQTAPTAGGQQQQTLGNSSQQSVVAPAADGQQQQQAAEDSTQPAAKLPAAGRQQRTMGAVAAAPTASQQQVQQGLGGESGQLGFSAQPLVDNSPFDSGSSRGLGIWSGASSAAAALLLVHALLLL